MGRGSRGRRRDWVCLFPGWGKERKAQIIDARMVSCSAAQKIIWSRTLDTPSEPV